MALAAGTRLGPYEVIALIGEGGMGQVYRATDTNLKRSVAIKVLPDAVATDAGRLARFQREAEMLARLNHPNIAQIHGLEKSDGTTALVMEFVEGPTLADRTAQGPMLAGEVIHIAKQIAEALEAAHELGIIHRDLKPANVKVRLDGTVKVLDFGLAKPVDTDNAPSHIETSHSPTRTSPVGVTGVGVLLGTVPYMSPEQARGQAVDKRTDIWAFGCVLYELLSGHMAFPGATITDTLAAIIEREPAWELLPVNTPSVLRRLLRRSLEKDPRRRLRDVGDARLELEEASSGSAAEELTAEPTTGVTRRVAIGTLLGATAGAAATGIFAVSRYRSDATPRGLSRFAIPLPRGTMATVSFNKRVAIAPDGLHLTCNLSPNGILIRSMGELEMRPAAEGAQGAPFFSPDSRWLGYFATDAPWRLRKVALSGGAPVTLCTSENFSGATWADDAMIYFVPAVPRGLARVAAGGGDPVPVVNVDPDRGERLYKFPKALPGSRAVLLTIGTTDTESYDDAQIGVVSLRTGEKRVLIEGGMCPCYSPSGHLVYARSGNLLAVRLDLDRLEVTGQPKTVLEGVLMSRNSGVANFDISATGDLVYLPGPAVGGARTLHWVDRSGRAEQLPLPPRSYLHPRLSPDVTKLAIEVEGSDHNVYVYDLRSGVLSTSPPMA